MRCSARAEGGRARWKALRLAFHRHRVEHSIGFCRNTYGTAIPKLEIAVA
jgi:hypothetical protein